MALGLAGAAQAQPDNTYNTLPHPGQAIYRAKCAACHDSPEQTRSPAKATLGAMSYQVISFALTKGNGWAIFGLVFVVSIVAAIAIGVADTLFGLIFILAVGQELGKLLAAVVASALSAAMGTLLVMLYAAIYRALAGTGAVAAAFE